MDSTDSGEPSTPAAVESSDAPSEEKIPYAGEPSTPAAVESSDAPSEENIPDAGEPSSPAAAESSDVPSEENNPYAFGEPSSPAAVESSDAQSEENIPDAGEPSSPAAGEFSDVPSEENIPYAEQLARLDMDTSDEDRGPSGLRTDELIFKALEFDDGNGLDFDEFFGFIEEMYDTQDDFSDRLKYQLSQLVMEGELVKIGTRYTEPVKNNDDIPKQSENASKSTEDSSTGAKPQDLPSTSSSAPTAPEENPQMEAAVKEVAEAEHLVFQAKEAQELADKHAQLLKLESNINLQLAVEIRDRCANGEKVFLR